MALWNLICGAYKRLLPVDKNVCLYYWKPTKGINFGDELSLDIVSKLLEKAGGRAAPLVNRCADYRRYSRRLLAIGSILHKCQRGDVVWGSGINGKRSAYEYDFTRVDLRAVRGPLTRRMVLANGGRCPEIYGDPGLLVADLFPEIKQHKERPIEFSVSLIPNINDMTILDGSNQNVRDLHIISPTKSWRQVAMEIQASEFVVSSSLHGIILADVFGVKCRPLLSLFESLFKFEDYFLSTHREGVRSARTVTEALELGAIEKPRFNIDPLLKAFPRDIFRHGQNSQHIGESGTGCWTSKRALSGFVIKSQNH